MPRFRLTYPTHLYATVAAPTVEEARQRLVAALAECQDGISVCVSGPDGDVEEEVLYPDSNVLGEVTVDLVKPEDQEPDDEEENES